MKPKKFNVGIVGYGWVSGAHIAAINASPLAQVTAVCSSRKLDPEQLSVRHGSPIKVVHRLEALLTDPDIHVVSICSYPEHHASQAIAAAKAGKHLIIEQPLAFTWDDCMAVEKAVRDARVKTCVGFECRYSSQIQVTKAVIDRGLLGTIHYGEVDYYRGIGPMCKQYRWNIRKSSGGSSLLSAGCHALDALLYCMGADVEVVSSYNTHSSNPDYAQYEYPTTSVTILKFKDGRVGKVASVLDAHGPYCFHVHLVGSEGTLLDNKLFSTHLPGLDRSRWSTLAMDMLDSVEAVRRSYLAQFEAFFTALDAGYDMERTSLADALRTHQIIFAADNSAERHAHPRRHA
ncbi:MAG: Gfo/Idh/MocA family oxidoreductase [Verrucomicrobia bacterium]|nr:Gfo/Idh/MocA family oxidoreductase [Verrucomicrobiota bacterium]